MTNAPRSPEFFLKRAGLEHAAYTFLAGDASLRKYYRLTNGVILMDAPPPEDPARFCQIADFLRSHGLNTPQIFATDFENGWVLLEDFGDMTYTQALKKGHNEEQLYETAVDTLIDLHQRITTQLDFLAPYDTQTLMREVKLLTEWYWPAIKGAPIPTTIAQEYEACWQAAFEACTYAPKSLILRDYHVDNVMIIPQKTCGLLDFQDALWGSVTYDLVSLLEDARRDISPTLQEKMWARYLAAFPHLDETSIKQEGAILSAGRHAKIIGIFTRLAIRDHKLHYLQHILRVWRLLDQCLTHPALVDVRSWFERYLPERVAPTPPITQAMILAAGHGKRLAPITYETPKPLIPLAGKPLLDYTLERLKASEIQKCVINTHHLADKITHYVAQRGDPTIHLSPESQLLETGGGITHALTHFNNKPFFSVNGDVWWQSDQDVFKQLTQAWREEEMDALLLLVPVGSHLGGRTTGDYQLGEDGRLTHDPATGPYIYSGIQLLHPRLFDGCEAVPFSIVPLYHKAQAKGRLFGCVLKGQWSDIGTPEDLALLEATLK